MFFLSTPSTPLPVYSSPPLHVLFLSYASARV
jgi:hypothetical protein